MIQIKYNCNVLSSNKIVQTDALELTLYVKERQLAIQSIEIMLVISNLQLSLHKHY